MTAKTRVGGCKAFKRYKFCFNGTRQSFGLMDNVLEMNSDCRLHLTQVSEIRKCFDNETIL